MRKFIGMLVLLMLVVGIVVQGASAQGISAGSLTTLYQYTSGCNGNMFDVTVYESLTITSFDQNIWSGAGPTTDVSVYYKRGSYMGYEITPGAWRLLGTATVNNAGDDLPSSVPIGGLNLTPGTYGFYIHVEGGNNYTYGTGTYSNAQMQISAGTGLCFLYGITYPGRIWNGTINYQYGNIAVPNVGMVQINDLQAQPAYADPAGEIARTSAGAEIWLPHDYDDNFYDTYVVTDTALIGSEYWVQIFLGSEDFAWVPLSKVTALSELPLD
jgi:hypothetical protein